MTWHTQWRRALARRLAAQLQHFDTVQAIALIGSVAVGYADAYSDLELLVLCDHAPDAALRDAIRRHLGADLRYPSTIFPSYDYALRIAGVPVDLWYTTATAEQAVIATVLDDGNLDLVANNRLALLAACVPLHGAALLARFKQRAAVYPDALALRFLEAYLPQCDLRNLNLAAQRDNPTTFVRLLSELQCSLFVVLLALNRVYFPTFKWMYPTLDRLTTTPDRLGERFRQMLVAPPPQAAAELKAVMDETLRLIAAQYPRLDTAEVRYRLNQPAQAYVAPDASEVHS